MRRRTLDDVKRITFHRKDGEAVVVDRDDDRKLSWSAAKRFKTKPPLRRRADGRFVDPFEYESTGKRPAPPKLCMTSKKALVRRVIDANRHVVEPCESDATGVNFEAINHKYSLTGKRKVTSCERAVAAVIPPGKPYCYDRIDLKTLNEIPAAKEHGKFHLPTEAQEAIADREFKRRR